MVWIIVGALGVLFLLAITVTVAKAEPRCTGPACCIRHGVQAVCRSYAIEKDAKAIVLRSRSGLISGDVTDWIFSLQMNRGPYKSAKALARDVLWAMQR
jgi:hypothetical protein